MTDPLAPLLADGIIDEVLSRLKSGKEADIYLVRHAGETLAAKVYKDRSVRSFKNDAIYREGRAVRNSRTQRAIEKGSRFGQAAAEDAWKAKEAEALDTLFAAGVRVPKPYLFYEGVLLMETVVDAEGRPAPRLIDAAVPAERARDLYLDLRQQVIRILVCDLIHGDLSPYNVLLAWNGPTVIDLPQVVGAAHNSQAEHFFRRDLEALRRFFASIDPGLNARGADAAEIWQAYVRRDLRPDFVPIGRVGPAAGPPRRPSDPSRPGLARGQNGAPRFPRRGGQPPTATTTSRAAASPRGASRTEPGPIVLYLGQPLPSTTTPPTLQPVKHHRRRRRRRRGGSPQS